MKEYYIKTEDEIKSADWKATWKWFHLSLRFITFYEKNTKRSMKLTSYNAYFLKANVQCN